MTKLILTTVGTAAALGLAACGYDKDEYNNQAGYNAEESNYSTDNAADYGNAADNMADTNDMNMSNNGTDNATGNAAVDNGY